jgi:hypothetical protein
LALSGPERMPELKAKQDWYPLTAESRKSPCDARSHA